MTAASTARARPTSTRTSRARRAQDVPPRGPRPPAGRTAPALRDVWRAPGHHRGAHGGPRALALRWASCSSGSTLRRPGVPALHRRRGQGRRPRARAPRVGDGARSSACGSRRGCSSSSPTRGGAHGALLPAPRPPRPAPHPGRPGHRLGDAALLGPARAKETLDKLRAATCCPTRRACTPCGCASATTSGTASPRCFTTASSPPWARASRARDGALPHRGPRRPRRSAGAGPARPRAASTVKVRWTLDDLGYARRADVLGRGALPPVGRARAVPHGLPGARGRPRRGPQRALRGRPTTGLAGARRRARPRAWPSASSRRCSTTSTPPRRRPHDPRAAAQLALPLAASAGPSARRSSSPTWPARCCPRSARSGCAGQPKRSPRAR
jgi:hypothetical protein